MGELSSRPGLSQAEAMPMSSANPTVTRLDSSSPHYSRVMRKFNQGWKHRDKRKPEVHAIFEIQSPAESVKRYKEYRARIAADPNVSNSKHPGNEKLLFHGTNRSCWLAEDTSGLPLCRLPDCHLCRVIRNSFDVRRCGTKHKFRRFGIGIYTTSCSSKADDYSVSPETGSESPFRVMLVNRVVVGNPYTLRDNAPNLIEPPSGHHSIVGEPGVDLNYPETVVYDNDAIRPAFLIVYRNPSKGRIHTLWSILVNTPLAY